jgi:hypothetical protein
MLTQFAGKPEAAWSEIMAQTFASIRDAAQEVTKRGEILPHQLAAFSALDQSLSPAQREAFTSDWRAKGSPAVASPTVPAADAWQAGLVGPKKRPDLKPGDHHLVVNDKSETVSAFDHKGQQLWKVPALARGQSSETDWRSRASDTPPGLYRVGTIYRDYESDPSATFSADRRAYGWYSCDLEGLEGQEGPGSVDGRDGIMLHGGGSACGWPGAWLPLQPLHPTLGCVRMHNRDLKDLVLPLAGMGTIYLSVWQESR